MYVGSVGVQKIKEKSCNCIFLPGILVPAVHYVALLFHPY
jgi:hypothetical protein